MVGATEGCFWLQNATYILAYLALGSLRPLWRRKTFATAKTVESSILVLCAARFVLAYVMIFTDSIGDGNMFTFDGVVALFRSKGSAWVVGLWTETLTLFVLLSLALVHDGEARGLPGWCTGAELFSGFFLSGLGFVLHLGFMWGGFGRKGPSLSSAT